ncbi:MAG TPA: DUF4389 domain-containing protein, partial [Candidatus Eisenbacteria bacterium]|nr:DUF4389 domain-containing protein [Candidatus Eisenbacteria bacterium]
PGGGPGPTPPRGQSPWTAGRIVAVVLGAILGLVSAGFLFGGGALLWADRTQREGGFLTSSTTTYSTGGAALATDRITLGTAGPNWPRGLLGDVRVRVTPSDPTRPVFVGIAPADAASTYLAGAQYTILKDFSGDRSHRSEHPGGAVTTPPARAGIWAASASGPGTQTVVWKPESGDWTIVAMNPDGAAGLTVRADIGAKVPSLPWVATALLAMGAVMLVVGILLITIPLVRVSRANAPPAQARETAQPPQ